MEVAGVEIDDAAVLEAVETRVGEPLSMRAVRETLDHLAGLGRFEDVRVYATPVAKGVRLLWALVPVQRIVEVHVTGHPEAEEAEIRTRLDERHGPTPSRSRVPEMIETLRAFYAERGYLSPAIVPRIERRDEAGTVALTLAVEAGARTTISNIVVAGRPTTSIPALLSALGVRVGGPYDRDALDRRAEAYAASLRERGHYEAAIGHTAVVSPDGARAELTLEVDPGPEVHVVFAGDPLPSGRRDDLVRIRDERSADEDLLEDASRNIAGYLRGLGYRDADVSYLRAEQDGVLTITFTVDRGVLHRVADISVAGADSLSGDLIAPLLQVKTGEPFVDIRVAAVASAITELYQVRGFREVVVTPEIAAKPATDTANEAVVPVDVTFRVVEGVATFVTDVAIEGANGVPASELQPSLTLTGGRPFYRPQLDADRDTLERLYRNRGFQAARVEARTVLSDDGRGVRIVWAVIEGEQTVVDHVLVTGNERVGLDVIRRELVVAPGKPLGEDAIAESQRRLSALGLFRRVRITELPRGVGAARDVLVSVEETPATTISYGGGLEVGQRLRPAGPGGEAAERLEVAPRVFFEVGRRNLWGKNRSATLFTRVSLRPRDPAVDSTDPNDTGGYGLNEYRFVGTFREPRALGTAGDFQFTAFLEQAIRSSFNFNRRGVRGEYARRLGAHITVSGRYAFDRTRLFDERIRPEDQLLIDRLFPQVRLSTFTASVLRDSRDDVLDPTRGTLLSVEGSIAARSIGSEVGFARSLLQGFVYRRLSDSPSAVTFVAGARAGFAVGFEREVQRLDEDGQPVTDPSGAPIVDIVKNVPASERFFAGGDTTVRGFALDRLGTDETLNDEGFPTGGSGLLVVNLELRSAYWKGLGLVGFFDAGNVFEDAGDIDVTELRSAAGFGLRYRSPLGPLRVDLGFKLDRRVLPSGSRERLAILHISLGQAF